MQLSLFSISYAGLWGQARLELPAFIAKAAELGYSAVMLAGKRPHLAPLDGSDEQLAALQGVLAEHRIACGAVAAYVDLAPSGAAEVPYVEMQIGYVESLARIASVLGAKYVRVFTAYEAPNQSPHAQWALVVRTLQEMCDRAAADGVTLAVQNHHDLAVHTTALLEMLADIGRANCKLGFDAWSPFLRGEDLYAAARAAAPHTAITTNADYIRLPRFRYEPALVNYSRQQPDLVRAVPFGTGEIDYEAFFRGLTEGGFNGLATYEMCSPIRGGGDESNLDRYAATYVRWMRERGLR
ncbi:MAG: sugar phosphate isomerase/epimerase [Pirellulaceae bacterium]|jgi:sugar phosphate isomerase/epimerase|nr:sugar phosphate isomerase/epimerase [Pirellulaceae bacterium]